MEPAHAGIGVHIQIMWFADALVNSITSQVALFDHAQRSCDDTRSSCWTRGPGGVGRAGMK